MNPTPQQDKEALTQEAMSFEQWCNMVVHGAIIHGLGGKDAFEVCWKARNAEIASLKEQLEKQGLFVRTDYERLRLQTADAEYRASESINLINDLRAKISALTTAGDEMAHACEFLCQGSMNKIPQHVMIKRVEAWTAATSMKV